MNDLDTLNALAEALHRSERDLDPSDRPFCPACASDARSLLRTLSDVGWAALPAARLRAAEAVVEAAEAVAHWASGGNLARLTTTLDAYRLAAASTADQSEAPRSP